MEDRYVVYIQYVRMCRTARSTSITIPIELIAIEMSAEMLYAIRSLFALLWSAYKLLIK